MRPAVAPEVPATPAAPEAPATPPPSGVAPPPDEPPTLDQWKAQVRETRAQGFAVDAGNYISGVTVVAAPVFRVRGKLSHALVAIGIGGALRRSGLAALERALASDEVWCINAVLDPAAYRRGGQVSMAI